MADHYATLGVDPDSSPAVIRAAYLRLMRLYHPDRNASPLAEAKVRKITAAYAVLGVQVERARYDALFAPAPAARAAAFPPQRQSGRRPSWLAVAFGVPAVLLLVIVLLPPVIPPQISEQRPRVGGGRASDLQDHVQARTKFNPGTVCSSAGASALIKRELFRRAAYLRRGDREQFDRLAGASLLKLQAAASEKTNPDAKMVSCTASIALELPQGVTVKGGQRGLSDTIGYSVHRGDGKNRATLRLADAGQLVGLLATLTRTPMNFPEVVELAAAPIQKPMSTPPTPERLVSARTTSAAAQPVKPQPTIALKPPSFSCNFVRSWAALSVCNSATLAGLDRELASLWGDSMARADAAERLQLLRSEGRFLATRDQCSSAVCVHNAYTAQIREIHSVMAARRAQTN